MDDEPLLPRRLVDPLGRIDMRFEPYDPVFDAEEEPGAGIWPRRPRRIGATKAVAAVGILFGCGEARPALRASDAVLAQLAPPETEPSDTDVERDDPDVGPNRWVAPDEIPGNREDEDADGLAALID